MPLPRLRSNPSVKGTGLRPAPYVERWANSRMQFVALRTRHASAGARRATRPMVCKGRRALAPLHRALRVAPLTISSATVLSARAAVGRLSFGSRLAVRGRAASSTAPCAAPLGVAASLAITLRSTNLRVACPPGGPLRPAQPRTQADGLKAAA